MNEVIKNVVKIEWLRALTSSRTRRLSKEGLWIVLGQIASVLGSIVLVKVLTEYLSPTQYGHLALGMTLAGFTNQVIMGGVSSSIGRFYSIASEREGISSYLIASIKLLGFATIAIAVIALVLMSGLFWFDYSQWMGLVVAALVFSVLAGYNGALNSIQNAARQRGVVAFHSGINNWLKILLVVGVMIWLGHSSTAVLIGYAMASLLVNASQVVFLRRLIIYDDGESQAVTDWLRQMWAFSWPFSVFGLFTWAQQVSDRWALQSFASTHEVGLYAVVFQLGYTPVSLATGMMVTFLGPILYQRSGNATDETRNAMVHRITWRITFVGLLVTAIVFVITIFLHDWIFHLLVASQYHSVSHFLPWAVLAGGFFAAGQMLSLKLMSELKPASMIVAKIATAIVGVCANMYGAVQFGMKGVIVALVGFSGIYLLWMASLSKYKVVDQ